jgi:hypothetical protein
VTQDPFSKYVPPLAVPLAAALVLYGLVLFLPQVLYDADTFWHIAAGEKMLQLRHVLHTDPFSHTVNGKEWQTHEWLSEIAMALAYRAGGWSGVVTLGATAAAAAAFLMGRWIARFLPPLSTAVMLIAGLAALMPSLLVRPHLLALPFLVGWVVALMKAREKDEAPPLWLPLLMVVWANLHGSYVFGLALIGPFALEALIGAPREKWLSIIWRWGLFGVLALAAALVTPHGIEGLIFPFQVMTMTSLPDIVEWRPVDFSKSKAFEWALLATLAVGFGRGVRIPWVRLAIILLLFHMALQHIRHVLVLGAVAPLLLAKPFGEAIAPWVKADFSRQWKAVLAVAAVIAVGLTGYRFYDPLERETGYHSPIAALDAVPMGLRQKPVLNSYGLGGYLIFKGVKVFIDGRADMYGDAYVKNYLKIGKGDQAALDKAIKQYGIEWMFLNPETQLARNMAKRPGWRTLFRDKIAVVYVREDYGRSTSLPSTTTR